MFLLSRLVRERGYKVVLTGEGADEMLGGYDIFKEAKIRRFWARQPDSTLRPLLLRRLYPYLTDSRRSPRRTCGHSSGRRPEDFADPFFSHLPRWELTSKLKLFFSPTMLRASCRHYDADRGSAAAAAGRLRRLGRVLPGAVPRDRAPAARLHPVVAGRPRWRWRTRSRGGSRSSITAWCEFAASLPPRLKMKVLEREVSAEARVRRPDAGVGARRAEATVSRAGRDELLCAGRRDPSTMSTELLSPTRLAADGLFNPAAVSRLVAKARAGRARHQGQHGAGRHSLDAAARRSVHQELQI